MDTYYDLLRTALPLAVKCHVHSKYTLRDVLAHMKTLRELSLEANDQDDGEFYNELLQKMKPVLEDSVREYVLGYAEREATTTNYVNTCGSAFDLLKTMFEAQQQTSDSPNPFEDPVPAEDTDCTCENGACPVSQDEDTDRVD